MHKSFRPIAFGWFCILLAGCATTTDRQDSDLSERDRITRLQVFLDERNFGPGKIDGQWGHFTEKSRERYMQLHGMEFDDDWERKMGVSAVNPIYTTYMIQSGDGKFIGNVPEDKEEQAKLKSMPYTSYAEFVAERFHTTENYLAALNPGLSIYSLKPGDALVVPNVTPLPYREH